MFMSLIALNQFSLADFFGLARSPQFYLRLSCDIVLIMADLLSCWESYLRYLDKTIHANLCLGVDLLV